LPTIEGDVDYLTLRGQLTTMDESVLLRDGLKSLMESVRVQITDVRPQEFITKIKCL